MAIGNLEMKAFWWALLALLAIIQYIGYGYFGKAHPIQALQMVGFLTAIVTALSFTWLFEKKQSGTGIILLLAMMLCLGPLSAPRGDMCLFDHAMAEFLEYDISRLSGLVGGIEGSIGSILYIFFIILTFGGTVFITASVFGIGHDGIERGGFAFFRKAYASFRKWEKETEAENKQTEDPKP